MLTAATIAFGFVFIHPLSDGNGRIHRYLIHHVEETINKIIPAEIDYLEKYDRLTNAINAFINLPNSKVDLLIKYLDQNSGRLSKRKRQKFFDELSEDEILFVEEQYAEIFNG